jgi:hypothetical protein
MALSPVKPKGDYPHKAMNNKLIIDLKNTDSQQAYRLDKTTMLQISYYHYQNAAKEATSSANTIHNEDSRLLLSHNTMNYQGHDYTVTVTGHLTGQKYVTISTYFYQSGDEFKQTNSKLTMQYQTMLNLLYNGTNAGGMIIIDKAIQPNQTPEQAISDIFTLIDKNV